jgi:hypothetical protein
MGLTECCAHFDESLILCAFCCSLRAIYGAENFKNALHGSDSKETAMRSVVTLLCSALFGAAMLKINISKCKPLCNHKTRNKL